MTEWTDVSSLDDVNSVIGTTAFLKVQDNNDEFKIPCRVLSIAQEYGQLRATLDDGTGRIIKKAVHKLVVPSS